MRKLAIFTGAFAGTVAGYVYLLPDARALWIAGACLLLSPLALHLGMKRFCAVFLGIAASLIWCFGYRMIWLKPAEDLCGKQTVIEAELLEEPERASYGAAVTVCIRLENRRYQALLLTDEALLEADAGDVVRCTVEAEMTALHARNGESLSHRADGTVLQMYAVSEPEIEPGTPDWPLRVRNWFRNRIRILYDGSGEGLLQALITGDQSGLTPAVGNDLSVVGMRHAVAVSGMHVSILLSMVGLLCGYNPRLTALLGIPLSLAFALITGASPSACRAALMQVLLLSAPLLRRENDPLTSLSAAALLLLLQNPWVIAGISFQLSFAAVVGLLAFSGRIQRRLLALQKKPGRLLRFVSSAVAPSLSAAITTLPLTVFYFEIISISAVVSNLLCLWAISLTMSLGLASCLLGAAGKLLAVPVGFLAEGILLLAEKLASFPYAAAYPQNKPLMIWSVCAYGLTVVLLLRKKKPSLWAGSVLTAAFLGCILWGRWNLTHAAPVIRVLDVGQGQSILLTTEEASVLVDCGPHRAGEEAVRTLHSGGQTHLDAVVLTHYDSDHAAGVEQLLHRVSVGLLVLPEVPDPTGMRDALEAAASEEGTEVSTVSTLTEVEFSGGKLTVYPPVSMGNDNNSGICVLATAAECDILITGDLDQFSEMRLLSRWDLPQVEVLTAGHHGAADSTSQILLDRVRPQLVTVSVGEWNSYGHPAQETLDRIAASGAEVRRTDTDGTIVIRTK